MAIVRNFFGTDIDTETIKKPSDLYRLMHPELFSDSHVEKEKMDKEQFKFILSNLSTDMRQDAFEDFTRRCVIKLITPNIIPQTGPTGGGDAKADLITYPVNEEASSIWTVPEGGCTGDEVWAFAVSTKKQWSQKMDSDVKKIVENIPNITRIYFCTNQPVSARNKNQKQEKYRKDEWKNINTYILDQNWYLQAVYDQGCYNDAIEALGLGDALKEVIVPGPLDIERKKRLDEIESKLPEVQLNGLKDQYVADLLEAAKLARGLGRAEQEVQGRFRVALDAARKYGFPQQVFECIYQKAWTDFYWYDNADATLQGYYEIKELLKEEVSVVRIEKITNLYRLLTTAAGQGLLQSSFDLEKERCFFEELCEELSNNPAKPSCTLFLKISLTEDFLMATMLDRGVNAKGDNETLDEVIDKLGSYIKEAASHMDIDFDSQAEVLINLGQLVGTNQKFDALIDEITDIQSTRSKDISAADIQYKRGLQHINNGNFEDAVKFLSRSNVLYHKENTITQMIQTSGFLGKAYSELDLLYCSKVYYGKALGMLFKAMGDDGRANHLIVTILKELCFVELRLGQLASFLEWLVLLDGVVATIPDYLDEELLNDRGMMDAMLGARIFETKLDNKAYAILPDIFNRHQLEFSRNVLLLKMGRKDDIADEYKFLLNSEDNTKSYIMKMSEDVRFLFPLSLNVEKKAHLRTLAHGCTFNVNYSGYTYSQTYSEMFLALMEMIMTGQTAKVFPSTPVINFDVHCDTEGETKIEQGSDSNSFRVNINRNAFSTQHNIWETLIGMFGHVISGSVVVGDLEKFLKERQDDDYFLQRISLLSGYPNDVSNFCPNNRKCYLEMFSRSDDQVYKFEIDKEKEVTGKNNRQSDAIVTSLIDIKLWDAAKWKGCGYLLTRDFSEPGIMVLMFENIAPGIKIFEQWEEMYKKGELNLKIVIITGVDKKHPQWYKVLITPDVKQVYQNTERKERYVISSSRFHLMNAMTDENVKALKMAFSKFSFIGLSASAAINNQISFDEDKRYNKVIPVRNVSFIEAWTIKENDIESVAILPNDDVLIPRGKENSAPVLSVIEKKKRYGQEGI